ncbi:MAG: TIGR01777 family oxidoreductase [Bacteroidia bacterium]
MKTVLITGGTGLIGMKLSKMLKQKGYTLHLLSRSNTPVENYDKVFTWNIHQRELDETALDGVTDIIHLAGAGIADARWTDSRKELIISSRVDSIALIEESLRKRNQKVQSLISGSAVGWYGARTDAMTHVEAEPAADDFMGETCRKWELAVDAFDDIAERIVKIRTGVVLAKDGGALPTMKMPFNFFVGSPLGSGKQQIQWIHLEDICRVFLDAVENDAYRGAYNASATESCSNREFSKTLAKVMNRPILPITVPSFALKMVLGEMSAVVLEGSRVSNKKLLSQGFEFKFNNLEDALKDLLDGSK